MKQAWAPTAIALAIVVGAACTTAVAPVTSATAGATATTTDNRAVPTLQVAPPASLPTSTLPTGTLVFGTSRQFALDGDLQSDLFAFPDAVVWSAAPWQPGAVPPRPGAGQIRELALATGAQRTTYAAEGAAASVTVKASPSWIVWLEAADTFGFSDGRLLALPRGGGPAILIDDVSQYRDRILFPMWTVDGADVYWTAPQLRDGRPFGQLKHKRLPDGPTEIAVDVQPGEVVALPSAYVGHLAYEIRSDRGEPRVVLRQPDGTRRDIAMPASEPTVGAGFVAFKQSPVAVPGALAAFVFDSGRIIQLGVGEQPRAGGPWLTWGRQPEPGDQSRYMSVFVSRVDFACVAPFVRPLPNTNSAVSIPAFGGDNAAWTLSNFDAPQLQRRTLVVEELRELHC